jgi:hydrogenase expression/formation protein HypE
MSVQFPELGKVSAGFLESLVYPRCGAPRPEVRVGPRAGVDTCVIDLPNGYSMAMTTDPCSLVPSLGLEESAWLTVHLLASDITTTGCPPMYALFNLNLPPDLSAEDFETYWGHIDAFCRAIDCAIVGGHTGRFEGQHSTVVGGGMMVTVAPRGEILTSAGARPGDAVIVTGQCGIAASAILARSFPQTVREACGEEVLAEGQALFYQSSTAWAAQTAVHAGRGDDGVRAMHDATEGGVRGALVELAAASACGIRIDGDAVPISDAVRRIAAVFALDPFSIVGSGALVIAAAPGREEAVLDALAAHGIAGARVGELTEPSEGMRITRAGGSEPLTHPGEDPYWKAFHTAFGAGWR